MVAETGTAGSIVDRYLRGANLICREQDGAEQYYLYNVHGDVVQRMDALGNNEKRARGQLDRGPSCFYTIGSQWSF